MMIVQGALPNSAAYQAIAAEHHTLASQLQPGLKTDQSKTAAPCQERQHAISRGSMPIQAIIFAYDVTRRETFESLSNIWLNEVDEFSTIQSAIKMVVANKVDRDSEREVSRQEGATFARQHGCLFVETSAKFNTAVTQVRLCGAAACELWCQFILWTSCAVWLGFPRQVLATVQ